ncbi:MAG: long-chain acyl-CoA synthetase, partial [Caulobacteraceae bacterium]
LRIIDRAKDVGRLTSGAMFAPKYIENKLKFFPDIREAVAFGDGRTHCCAFVNMDLAAMASWAERNHVAYGSYQELAADPRVYAILRGHIEEVNRDLAREPRLAASQITRFLVLPKELDADDGELTRTRKLRRNVIEERYAPLIAALYSNVEQCRIETEITFEDGRKGRLAGDVRVEACRTFDTAAARATASATAS